jgi:hypothetical protein
VSVREVSIADLQNDTRPFPLNCLREHPHENQWPTPLPGWTPIPVRVVNLSTNVSTFIPIISCKQVAEYSTLLMYLSSDCTGTHTVTAIVVVGFDALGDFTSLAASGRLQSKRSQ